jgi:hypothetical protein
MDIDQKVRIAAFNWLDKQVGIHGDVLPRSILSKGFEFENQRVPLVVLSRGTFVQSVRNSPKK